MRSAVPSGPLKQFFRSAPSSQGEYYPKPGCGRASNYFQRSGRDHQQFNAKIFQNKTNISPLLQFGRNSKSMLVNQLVCMGVASIVMNHKLAEQLQHFLENWKVITKDCWILKMLLGYNIDFLEEPYQHCMPHTPHYSPEQDQLIFEEVRELLGKGAVSVVTTAQMGFYSNLFLA